MGVESLAQQIKSTTLVIALTIIIDAREELHVIFLCYRDTHTKTETIHVSLWQSIDKTEPMDEQSAHVIILLDEEQVSCMSEPCYPHAIYSMPSYIQYHHLIHLSIRKSQQSNRPPAIHMP